MKRARAGATEVSFRAAFELVPDGIVVSRGNRIIYANGLAASVLAAPSPDDLSQCSLVDLFAPSDQQAVRDRLLETSGSSAPSPPSPPVPLGELTMIRFDGRSVQVEMTVMAVCFDGQDAILGVFRDVSARRELVAQTMEIDRMLAVGRLAAGVGHEINNPLAYVLTNVAFASDEIARAHEILETIGERESTRLVATILSEVVTVLADVEEGAQRIREIARDLNTFARNDEERALVDLREVADSALRMAAAEIRQRARVRRDYEDTPLVRTSAPLLGKVLLNLIINAAQSIPRDAYDSNEIAVRVRLDRSNVVIDVSDTGCGIAPEHRARLFEPFFTTKAPGEGTGLGLSMSRRIVRSLGGDIDVESVPGRGTTMHVSLPR